MDFKINAEEPSGTTQESFQEPLMDFNINLVIC